MTSALEIVDDIASRQWSLVTRRQLLDAKISSVKIASLLRSGVIRRIGPRVYATCGSPRVWEQSVLAEVLAAGSGAVASHAAAARLWHYTHLPMDGLDVTIAVDRSTSFSKRGRGVHRTVILRDEDVTERANIPCTSFERTLCDCTTLLSPFQLGRVLDDGLRRSDVSLDRLTRCVAALDSGPRRRLSIIKQLLAERRSSFDPGGSASELHVLQVIRDAGLREPVQQHRVRVGGRLYALDFAWPDQKIFVEYYGLAFHSGASAVAYDSTRLTGLVALGWRPLVFTDSTPDREIVESVSALLASGQSDWSLTDREGA
jgi:very-short-patch-repair endonuclease